MRAGLRIEGGATQSLTHVLWIGGPPGSGKTAIAKRIARRHGLRWYSADAHTWEHRDRALRDRHPAALRWEAMTPDERWVTTTPAEMAELSLESERGPMILDDLRRLPASPLILAEGTPLLPELVALELADSSRAVWLVPTLEFERGLLEERAAAKGVSDPERARENRIELALLMASAVEREATERGLKILAVDGSRSVDEMVAVVEEAFAEALAEGPWAETEAVRRALLRYANASIAAQFIAYFERMRAAGDLETATYPFQCECGDTGCEAVVEVAVAAFPRSTEAEAAPVLANGHG